MMAPLEVVQHFYIFAQRVGLGNYLLTTAERAPELQPSHASTCHREMSYRKGKKNTLLFLLEYLMKNHSEEVLLAFHVFIYFFIIIFLLFFFFPAFLNKATSFEQSSLGCRNISGGMLGQRACQVREHFNKLKAQKGVALMRLD